MARYTGWASGVTWEGGDGGHLQKAPVPQKRGPQRVTSDKVSPFEITDNSHMIWVAFLQDPENLMHESTKQAEDGSSKYGIPKTRRIRRTKRMPGEATQEAGLSIGEEFRRVAIQILDRLDLGMEMKERFVRLKQHAERRFGFLLDLNSFLPGDHMTSE